MLKYALIFYGGMIPADHFDIWLRFYMRRRKLTVEDMAERTGKSIKTVRSVINGESRPDVVMLGCMGLEWVDGGYKGAL
jgi:predicted DNA-binding transcriptional regulator AlpA